MAHETTGAVALMSIHPGFAEDLMSGDKKVEFRRIAPKFDVSHVVVYATKPIAAVIGVFEVEKMDRTSPRQLWSRYGSVGGIDRSDFFAYYEGTNVGVALVVKKTWRCPVPLGLNDGGLPARPPQSFMYLAPQILDHLRYCA